MNEAHMRARIDALERRVAELEAAFEAAISKLEAEVSPHAIAGARDVKRWATQVDPAPASFEDTVRPAQ